jgi:hypothetical protein
MEIAKRAVLLEVLKYDQYYGETETFMSQGAKGTLRWRPASFMLAPIYHRLGLGAEVVGALAAEMPWDAYFSNLILVGIDGLFLVVCNTCGQMQYAEF